MRRCLRHGTLHHHLSPPPPSSPSSITLRLHSIDVRRAIFHGATHLRSSYHRYRGYRPRLPRPFALMLDKGEVTASCSASSLALPHWFFAGAFATTTMLSCCHALTLPIPKYLSLADTSDYPLQPPASPPHARPPCTTPLSLHIPLRQPIIHFFTHHSAVDTWSSLRLSHGFPTYRRHWRD